MMAACWITVRSVPCAESANQPSSQKAKRAPKVPKPATIWFSVVDDTKSPMERKAAPTSRRPR
jgi:hypothetical protein